MTEGVLIGLIVIGAYLAGSCNFSILLFKLLGKEDPRLKFSGNAGATNVYRQAGLFWALLVLLLDGARAVIICLIGLTFLELRFVPWVGLSLILGNRFPCFHSFRGGKGVANYLGFSLLLVPAWAGLSVLAWALAFALTRIPFIASFAMILILGAGAIIKLWNCTDAIVGTLLTVILILYAHKNNVLELIRKHQASSNELPRKS